MIIDRCSVSQDDYGDWWLEFYVDDIRHAVLVSEIAAQTRTWGCLNCGDMNDGVFENCQGCGSAKQ